MGVKQIRVKLAKRVRLIGFLGARLKGNQPFIYKQKINTPSEMEYVFIPVFNKLVTVQIKT